MPKAAYSCTEAEVKRERPSLIPSELPAASGSERTLAKVDPPVNWSDTTSGGVGSWSREELVELWLDRVVKKRSSVEEIYRQQSILRMPFK